MRELYWRMRNSTKNIYEYVWLADTESKPTVLPDNPSDECAEIDTAIVGERVV